MAVTKINADGWSFEVNAVAIKGIEDFDISRAITRADTIDFESEGSEEHRVIRRGKVLTLNGHYLEDEANGDRDPGQQAI
ncbi:MAG: hypothetical protein Q8Q52_03140, partial [Acidimicrobiia bacterium]|nr:hypothetical protein [Acidimicrobiia bacterium]